MGMKYLGENLRDYIELSVSDWIAILDVGSHAHGHGYNNQRHGIIVMGPTRCKARSKE